jgi:hypothetical protein
MARRKRPRDSVTGAMTLVAAIAGITFLTFPPLARAADLEHVRKIVPRGIALQPRSFRRWRRYGNYRRMRQLFDSHFACGYRLEVLT